MAEPKRQPRRVSMAYVLGFSDKPFKDIKPPPPPKPPSRNALTEPGGFFEWVASDGRKGKLTGKGKASLTAANVAKVPSDPQPAKAASKKAASKKSEPKKEAVVAAVVAAVEETGGLMGLFEDAPVAVEEKKTDAPAAFTEDQDKKLMEMKDSNKTWAEIATELSKDVEECKERFKQIKPKDWKPKDNGGNNNQQNKGGKKNKGQGKPQSQNGDKKEEKKDEKKEEKKDEETKADANGNDATKTENNETSNTANGQWDPTTWGNINNADANNTDTANAETSLENKENTGEDAWAARGEDNTGGEATWGNDGTEEAPAAWDDTGAAAWNLEAPGSNKAPSKSGGNAWDDKANAWDKPVPDGKPASKSGSKAGSKTGSKKSSSKPQNALAVQEAPAPDPLLYEIAPDETFSGDDLRMIARILQQDARMVWERVSWRFRDKTGRNLDPDVFEAKITGQIEEKVRSGGSRRG